MYKFTSSIYRTPPSLFSRMQIDSALEDDFTIHYDSYKYVINAIRPVKPQDFHEASVVHDTFYRFTSNTPPQTAGEVAVISLTAYAKAVVDVPHIIRFSDKLDSIWGTLKAMKPLSEHERTQAAHDFIAFYKRNTI